MDKRQNWIEWIKSLPTWVTGAIGLATAVITFVALFQKNCYLGTTVLSILLVIALLCLFSYLAFAKTSPLVVGGKGVHRFGKYRPWALAGIGVTLLLVCTAVVFKPSRSFIVEAFRGPVTPAPTPTLTPTATPLPFIDSFTYTDPQGLCLVLTDIVPQAGRANAIKITFDISSLESYCGWGIQLNGYDASAKVVLTFWVKGEAGGEQFEISVKDSVTRAGGEPKVAQVASDTWQQVSIPLDEFEGQNLASLDRLTLSLKHALGSDTIYVADFSFGDVVP